MTNDVAFEETQYIRQVWWITLLLFGLTAFIWYGFIIQIFFGVPFGANPAPDWEMWLLWLIFGIGLPLLFYRSRLIVTVKADGLHLKFIPFTTRHIPFEEIKKIQARRYNPIKEYGGWGIQGWSRKRMAYNVRGNLGVELTLSDGRQVMIGSQRPYELAEAIERLWKI